MSILELKHVDVVKLAAHTVKTLVSGLNDTILQYYALDLVSPLASL